MMRSLVYFIVFALCVLAAQGGVEVFSDGFESGDTSEWSETSQQACVHLDFEDAPTNTNVEDYVSPYVTMDYLPEDIFGENEGNAWIQGPVGTPSPGSGLLVYIDAHTHDIFEDGEVHMELLVPDMRAVRLEMTCYIWEGGTCHVVLVGATTSVEFSDFPIWQKTVVELQLSEPIEKIILTAAGLQFSEFDSVSISEFTPTDCSPGPEIPGM